MWSFRVCDECENAYCRGIWINNKLKMQLGDKIIGGDYDVLCT